MNVDDQPIPKHVLLWAVFQYFLYRTWRFVVGFTTYLGTLLIKSHREKYVCDWIWMELQMDGACYDYRDYFWRPGDPGPPPWAQTWERA